MKRSLDAKHQNPNTFDCVCESINPQVETVSFSVFRPKLSIERKGRDGENEKIGFARKDRLCQIIQKLAKCNHFLSSFVANKKRDFSLWVQGVVCPHHKPQPPRWRGQCSLLLASKLCRITIQAAVLAIFSPPLLTTSWFPRGSFLVISRLPVSEYIGWRSLPASMPHHHPDSVSTP